MCGLSEVDVEGEHGMHRGIVAEVSSGLQACVCGGSASGGGEVGGGGGGVNSKPWLRQRNFVALNQLALLS